MRTNHIIIRIAYVRIRTYIAASPFTGSVWGYFLIEAAQIG